MEHKWVAVNDYQQFCENCGLLIGSWELAEPPYEWEYEMPCEPEKYQARTGKKKKEDDGDN